MQTYVVATTARFSNMKRAVCHSYVYSMSTAAAQLLSASGLTSPDHKWQAYLWLVA